MAFKRSAVRSRVAPPLNNSFLSIISLELISKYVNLILLMKKVLSTLIVITFVASCGGGGGGGGGSSTPPTPAPSVSLTAEPTSVLLNDTSTLTWSATNASSCSAGWTSSTSTSGSETVTVSTAGTNSYSITCSGAGGDRSASVSVEAYRNTDGVVVDGYISGAEVCIDENSNWMCESSESSTTSDNDGKFTIRYSNGNLVSIGGTDLDSQTLLDNLLITHKLTGHSDFKAVTPVTSVAAFMADASLINSALGIDASIDVFTFDPVANKGDGGINDNLYEKGNQLTVLAFALQNITNNLNTTSETTQDYFKAITEEIEKEFTATGTKVDIETEAFVTNVLENLITAKSLTITENAKANIKKALSGMLPIIQVKPSDDVTTSIIRFGLSTLQTDIQNIANGTASAETVTSYTEDLLNYIAQDQSIDADEIVPDITAIPDTASTSEDTDIDINILLNDSYVTSSPFNLSVTSGSNGSTVVVNNIVTYSPDADYNGTDTFSYTITQGEKTSSTNVTVVVEAVNDAPSIDIASTIEVKENETDVATVNISDVDEDNLTLTIEGTDADSFNLSTDNALTFKEPPDYETKTSYSIVLSLTDGTETVTKEITISIIDVNDAAPIFTSEKIFNAAENQTSIGTVTASDPEEDSFSFSTSSNEILITAEGVLTFVSAPDYETKSSYAATITVTDTENNSATQDITVNVTNVNDNAPVITSDAIFTIPENQTTIGTIVVTDADNVTSADTTDYTFSIESMTEIGNNRDADLMNIDSKSGLLSFISPPDWENPQDYNTGNNYRVRVTVTDGIYSHTKDFTVNVTNINDVAPDFTSNAIFSAVENQSSIGTVTATDAEGDDVTFTVSGSELEITSSGVLTFIAPPDYETKTTYTATITASDGVNSNTQDITVNVTNVNDVAPVFTSSASLSGDENQTSIGTVIATDVEGDDITFTVSGSELEITAAGVLTFAASPDYETETSYSATVTATDGINSATQDITVQVINLNDNNPVFTSSATLNADENQTGIATITATDADGDTVTFTISGSDLAITSDGVLTFLSAPDYESVQSFTAVITASDSEKTTDQSITVNVNNLNDNAPVYTAATSLNASENQTSAFTATATDADGDSLTFNISGGADKDDFSIVNTSGVVTFNTAPDYETKNSYVVVIDVLDGGFTTSQEVNINITDVNEAPIFTTSSTFDANENQSSVDTVSASDPEGATISYSLSGTDASALAISDSGVLTFNTAPNYESKNSYSITANAADGTNTTTQDITISINDVNDLPVVSDSSLTFNMYPETSKTLTLSASDEDGDTLTYSIESNGTYGTASFTNQEKTKTIEVSVNSGAGFAYVIDGTLRKSINLTVGTTYTFTHPVEHPLRFSRTSDGTHGRGSQYTDGVTTSAGSTTIEITGSTPTTIYYYCDVHSGMGGTATLTNTNTDASITYEPLDTTKNGQSESFTFKVNDGSVDSDTATVSIDINTDPLYPYVWHLDNTGQTNFATNGGIAGEDLNVDSVINDGITGSGVKIAIIDEDLEIAHEDLVDNVIDGSWDFVNSSNNPTEQNSSGGHGTAVAGLMAAKGWNNLGTRGIAPNASIIGYNYLKDQSTVAESQSLGVNPPGNVLADIYNMSYGLASSGFYSPDSIISSSLESAYINGITNLRDGKGAIYTKSAGNGFDTGSGDYCGTDYTCTELIVDKEKNIPYSIIVAALNAEGLKSSYSTTGPGIWVSGFGGEDGTNTAYSGFNSARGNKPAMMTVDKSTCNRGYVQTGVAVGSGSNYNEFNSGDNAENPSCNYVSDFGGTSSAAPTVAGVVALMLEANPDLTWRDVKHIFANTSDKIDPLRRVTLGADENGENGIAQYEWETNSAGYEFHNWYGFGKVNAAAAVASAKEYTANSLGSFVSTGYIGSGEVNIDFTDGETITSSLAVTSPSGSNNNVEFVRVSLQFTHTYPFDVGVRLLSPDGTEINIMQAQTNVTDTGSALFDIGVSALYGESIEGTWTIGLSDFYQEDSGTLIQWGIEVYGN